MKITSICAFVMCALFFASCSKSTSDLIPQGTNSLSATDQSNLLQNGGSPNGNGDVSGVSLTTGYEELNKYMTRNASGVLVWDGRTYEASWYNQHLFIVVNTPINNSLGYPVGGNFTVQANDVFTSIGGAGAGTSVFSIQYTNIGLNYTINYNANWNVAVNDYLKNFQLYYLGISSTYPSVDPSLYTSVTTSSNTGSKVFTVYGKLIKINTGTGYALAELQWKPTYNPATAPPPGSPEP